MSRAPFRFVRGVAVALPLLVVLAAGGCSKKSDTPATKGPGPANAATGGPATPPVAPPATKPQGPLQSKPGTRPAMLEIMPQGRLAITFLSKDRKGPEVQEFTELPCQVFSDGKTESGKIVARPTEKETDGKTARFSGFFKELTTGKPAALTITFPSGEPRMAQFDVPEGYRTY